MILIPQIAAAFLIGVAYYLIAMAMTIYDGVLSMLFQPVIGALVTAVALGLLLLAGLPIRLMRGLNVWWRRHWWLPLAIGTGAFLMMCASWLPQWRVALPDPDTGVPVQFFNPWLGVGGWLATLFAVLHFYPPWPRFRSSGK